jgi:predicted P-loop ATPase/GTPase
MWYRQTAQNLVYTWAKLNLIHRQKKIRVRIITCVIEPMYYSVRHVQKKTVPKTGEKFNKIQFINQAGVSLFLAHFKNELIT